MALGVLRQVSCRGLHPLGLLAGELLPTTDDHVDVELVHFHQKRRAARPLGSDQSAPRAPEQIKNVLSGLGGIGQGPFRQLDRLLGEMEHVLRRDLLDGPQIGGIVGAKETMGSAFFPTVEAPPHGHPCSLCGSKPGAFCPR